jgi:hypothetical protein
VGVGQSTTSTDNFITSNLATAWTAAPVPVDATSDWTAVGYGAHMFVAVDASGNIAWLDPSGDCSAAIPTSPQQVSGNIDHGKVWTYMHPPSSVGGAPVNSYRVNITNGTITRQCSAPVYFEPNCIIAGLADHQVYWVTAQSHNRFGYSVPTDPEFVIPVASWNFSAVASAPVVSAGDAAGGTGHGCSRERRRESIPAPRSRCTLGARSPTCHTDPFGECILTIPNPPVGTDSIYATYTGYGKWYHSPMSHVTVQS